MYSIISYQQVSFFFIQIDNATSNVELKNIIEVNSDVLIDNGITTSLSSIKKKNSVVKALSLQYIILKLKGELDQLKDGLITLGVGSALQLSPSLFESLFTTTGQVELTPGKNTLNISISVAIFQLYTGSL